MTARVLTAFNHDGDQRPQLGPRVSRVVDMRLGLELG